jgi:hypothetical protein
MSSEVADAYEGVFDREDVSGYPTLMST